MKVLAINGSPRKNGNTNILLKTVCKELEAEGIATEIIQVGGQTIHGCTACYRCQDEKRCAIESDILNDIVEKMKMADGVILGSPVYFADITPELKAVIDRSGLVLRANGFPLRRKAAAGIVAVRRGGAIHALDTISHFLHYQQTVQIGSTYWNFAFGRAEGDVESDEEGMGTMKTLGENMAWLMKKLA